MKKKSPRSSSAKISPAQIADAALTLAAKKDWAAVSPEAVAKALKTSVASVHEQAQTNDDIAVLCLTEIDNRAFDLRLSGAVHDKLFDLTMARFDEMQQHRAAFLSLFESARQDKKLGCRLGRAVLEGSYRMANLALDETAPPLPLAATGLAAIFAYGFWAWRKDDSRDLSKTMAATDRALRLSGKAVAFFKARAA